MDRRGDAPVILTESELDEILAKINLRRAINSSWITVLCCHMSLLIKEVRALREEVGRLREASR